MGLVNFKNQFQNVNNHNSLLIADLMLWWLSCLSKEKLRVKPPRLHIYGENLHQKVQCFDTNLWSRFQVLLRKLIDINNDYLKLIR